MNQFYIHHHCGNYRYPHMNSFLQVIVDEKKENSLFVLTGSRQFELMEKVSQSLAGRTALLKLLPFTIKELETYKVKSLDEIMFKGFYPRIYDQDIPPYQAYSDYFETYIERDLQQLVNIKNLSLFHRFITLCAGRTGNLLNLSNLADDTGISHSTAREWITVLQALYGINTPFVVESHFRPIKAPKDIYPDIKCRIGLQVVRNENKKLLDYSEIMTRLEAGQKSKFVDFISDYIDGNVENTQDKVDTGFNEKYPLKSSGRYISDNPLNLNVSQKRILLALNNLQNKIIVVDGPPGTGESLNSLKHAGIFEEISRLKNIPSKDLTLIMAHNGISALKTAVSLKKHRDIINEYREVSANKEKSIAGIYDILNSIKQSLQKVDAGLFNSIARLFKNYGPILAKLKISSEKLNSLVCGGCSGGRA